MNRFRKLTALGGVVVAVLIAMILRTGLASATSKSSCGSWNVVYSPSPSSGSLNGIAAVSANDIWAVGEYLTNGDNGVYQTLIEHWDGKRWSIASSPNASTNNNFLYAVTRVPTTEQVWAAGVYSDNFGGPLILTESSC